MLRDGLTAEVLEWLRVNCPFIDWDGL